LQTFSYVKRGYNPAEVDAYVSTLEQVIKSYKDKDNAIKNAIISAQVAADNITKNAYMQAEEYKQRIHRQLRSVKESAVMQRARAKAFQDMYAGLVKKYLHEIGDNEMTELYEQIDSLEAMIDDLRNFDEPNAGGAAAPIPQIPANERKFRSDYENEED
jgi:DivIVA domain-containing protein